MTEHQSAIRRLGAHAILGSAPPEELAWLAEHGTLRRFEVGDLLTTRGTAVEALYILLDGHIAIYPERGKGQRKMMEWFGGDITGVLPYSRMGAAPGDTVAEIPTEVWTVPRERIPELIRACPETTALLVHVMTDRARHFTSTALEDEKTLALGRVAAGLAHELNNPASAIVRSAKHLVDHLVEVQAAGYALGARGLDGNQMAAVERVRQACLAAPPRARSAVDRADREEAMAEWIEQRGGDESIAGPLADTAAGLDDLAALATTLDDQSVQVALRWIATECAARGLAAEIQRGASRIFDMISAVKGFTHMDRGIAPEAVDVGQGLRDTVAVLAAKAGAKAAEVRVRVEPDLPSVQGLVGDLNQMWAALIDNALDAVRVGGKVSVTAAHEGRRVVVEVTDDGPGIPASIRGRIFDPFFTTKEVGEAVGLGLDLVRRSLERHDGEVTVESRTGRTTFRVELPTEGTRSRTRLSRETTRIQIDEE